MWRKHRDNTMVNLLGTILCSSIKNLFDHQPDIFDFTHQTGETEWNLCHHLANEIRKYIFWLNHDIDIIKRNLENRRPDIVFHKRGINALNFLVIELKHRGDSSDEDIKKIKHDWMGPDLLYRFGASINITDKNKYKVIVFHENRQREFTKASGYINPRTVSKSRRQSLLTFVDQILATKKKNPNAPACAVGGTADRDTSALERQIDKMVYELYGLTDDEIAIVEGENANK